MHTYFGTFRKYQQQQPDRPFRISRASNRRILCGTQMSIDGLVSFKTVNGPVRRGIRAFAIDTIGLDLMEEENEY